MEFGKRERELITKEVGWLKSKWGEKLEKNSQNGHEEQQMGCTAPVGVAKILINCEVIF